MKSAIFNKLLHLLEQSDNKWIIRKRVLNTTLLFRLLSQSFTNNHGFKHTLSKFYLHHQISLSDAALCKARNKCNSFIFENIKNKLIEDLPISSNVYAIDGSKLRLPSIFQNYGFTTRDTTSKHILGMISCCFDVHNKLPIHTQLFKHYNERTAAIEHFSKI
jgi:hypothetical protein